MSALVNVGVVLFDFYLTLVDIHTDEHSPHVWDKLARFLRYRGYDASAEALRDRFFGLAHESLARSAEAFPEVDVLAAFEQILSEMRCEGATIAAAEAAQLFRALSVVRFATYPDSERCLRRLKTRYRVGLVSDAQRVFLDSELRMTALGGLMDVIVVSSDHPYHKPDPRLFAEALGRLGAGPASAAYVGDSPPRDVVGARTAGLVAIHLNRGGHAWPPDAPPPDLTIGNLDELCNVLGVQ